MIVETFISYDLSTEEINVIIVVKTLLVEQQEYPIDEFLGYDANTFFNILQEILDNGADIR